MQLVEEDKEERALVVEMGSGLVSRVAGLASGSAVVYERVGRLASGSAVVVFSLSGCCMCHVVKHLLLGLGVGPAMYELDQLRGGAEIQAALLHLLRVSFSSSAAAMPAVFVGGQLLGGLEQVMSCHINGSLVPLLKQAGALWL